MRTGLEHIIDVTARFTRSQLQLRERAIAANRAECIVEIMRDPGYEVNFTGFRRGIGTNSATPPGLAQQLRGILFEIPDARVMHGGFSCCICGSQTDSTEQRAINSPVFTIDCGPKGINPCNGGAAAQTEKLSKS